TAPPETYTLSLHDALPIWRRTSGRIFPGFVRASATRRDAVPNTTCKPDSGPYGAPTQGFKLGPIRSGLLTITQYAPPCALPVRRSEEHTSELQSQSNLVCR